MALFGLGRAASARASEVLAPQRRARLSSPWAPGLDASIIAADWIGATSDLFPVTRQMAMKVPAVVEARNLICLSFAQGVLRAYRGSGEISAPAWCYRTDSDVPPQTRLLWTADDLFFTGYSLWEVARGSTGAIGDASRVPPERWDWDEDMRILIDEQPVQAQEVILFTGWDDGLLYSGNTAIRHALELADEVARRVRVPQAHTLLKASDSSIELTDAEQKALLSDFVAARRSKDGAASYIPWGVEVDQGGEVPVSLYENGRNASTLDIARLTGVPATMLDASGTNASLTYQTTQMSRSILNDRRRERATVIEARLSMDDVVPRGTRIALDLSAITGPDMGLPAPQED